jgi:hypothetical protein
MLHSSSGKSPSFTSSGPRVGSAVSHTLSRWGSPSDHSRTLMAEPAPKGRPTLAQRFSAGNFGRADLLPEECPRPQAESTPTIRAITIFVITLLLSTLASAATLRGTITNGTTGKPSAGDEVILIKLAAGMEEIGHAQTDAKGNFAFTFDDADAPHLVRAVHQGVTYHTPAPPGTSTVQVEVYDVSPKLADIHEVADVMYIQAKQGSLGITRLFAVDNASKPARTQMNDANFEFYLPEGAQIDEAQAQTAGGQGVNIQPTPQAGKGRYAFDFPLRPGQTQFQVSYHLPYSGKAMVDPKLIYRLQHFVAILPRSITFSPTQAGIYEAHQPPDQPDGIAEIANNPDPGQKLGFEISGTGIFQSQQQAGEGGQDNRPGGGLGAPIQAPDPLDRYRSFILAGFAVVLVAGAVYTVNRSKSARAKPAVATAITSFQAETSPAPLTSNTPTPLLAALKEELFQLELEHKQGQISEEEYRKAKAALDATLARAIKRSR